MNAGNKTYGNPDHLFVLNAMLILETCNLLNLKIQLLLFIFLLSFTGIEWKVRVGGRIKITCNQETNVLHYKQMFHKVAIHSLLKFLFDFNYIPAVPFSKCCVSRY